MQCIGFTQPTFRANVMPLQCNPPMRSPYQLSKQSRVYNESAHLFKQLTFRLENSIKNKLDQNSKQTIRKVINIMI